MVNDEDFINILGIEDTEVDRIQNQDLVLKRLKRAILRKLSFVGVLRSFARSHKYIYLKDNRLFREVVPAELALIVPDRNLTK